MWLEPLLTFKEYRLQNSLTKSQVAEHLTNKLMVRNGTLLQEILTGDSVTIFITELDIENYLCMNKSLNSLAYDKLWISLKHQLLTNIRGKYLDCLGFCVSNSV